MEYHTGGSWGNFDALVVSIPVDADLLRAENWTFSRRLPKPDGIAWLEGNVLRDPEGNLVNVLRTNGAVADRAAVVRVDAGGTLAFDPSGNFVDMPGGGAKFTIRYDGKTARYWALVNRQTDPDAYRNHLVLVSSADLRRWRDEITVLFHPDRAKHAWQYADWLFEGDDIVFVSRTAFDDGAGGARRAHDANFMTFHRIRDFRGHRGTTTAGAA